MPGHSTHSARSVSCTFCIARPLGIRSFAEAEEPLIAMISRSSPKLAAVGMFELHFRHLSMQVANQCHLCFFFSCLPTAMCPVQEPLPGMKSSVELFIWNFWLCVFLGGPFPHQKVLPLAWCSLPAGSCSCPALPCAAAVLPVLPFPGLAAALPCAVLCCAVLCCAVLCCAVLCCAVLCRAIQLHALLQCICLVAGC